MSTLETKLAAGLAAMNLQLPAESQQKQYLLSFF